MAIIVVGGHTRNLGKTQLVVEILRAFPAACWTAVKVTQEKLGLCPVGGAGCGCAAGEHLFSLAEERDPGGRSDTARFLAAGATRAFWVRTRTGQVSAAWPTLERELAAAANAILESNSVLRFFTPDLYLPLLDFSCADFKESAREFLARADAYIVRASGARPPAWAEPVLRTKPVFEATAEQLCSPALLRLLRGRLTLRARRP